MPDPALREGWEPWTAHASLAPALAGTAAVCGAMVFSPDGRTVLAIEPASSVTALGARHEIKMLTIRQDAPAALAALAFEPLFAVLSSGGRKDDSKSWCSTFRLQQRTSSPESSIADGHPRSETWRRAAFR